MEIYRDFINEFYSLKNKIIGNCITVNDNSLYFYEFDMRLNKAYIKYSNDKYINEAISEFLNYNPYVYEFYDYETKKLLRKNEMVYTFKLPISCIQPSKFFLKKSKVDFIMNNINPDNIYIPVAIINDEYVCLNNHSLLKALYDSDYKMVNVYLAKPGFHINDFVYVAKENNITSFKAINLVSDEDYLKYWIPFKKSYFEGF